MAALDIQESTSVSTKFFEKLFEYPNGEKTRSCIQCGTCSGICPYGQFMEYPPRKIIHALRMDEFDMVLESDTVWMCVSCYACSSACPQQIPLSNVLMMRLKEELLLSGQVPAELQEALENSQRYGNPMGESPRKRADWAKGFDPPIPIMAKEKRAVDVLWFVGDFASYHPAARQSTIAFAKILNELGIDFGILGPEESSDGDSQRLAGEYGLFELLAENNARIFDKYEFKEIITTDPHAYNALRNEYPKLGFSYPVRHYTEFLLDYLDELQPLLKHEVSALIGYHDPCFLGRANDIYEEPRKLLEVIPGVELVELSHSRSNSLCCGGGGGGMWLDGYQWDIAEARSSEWRIGEIVAAKPVADFVSVLENGSKPSKKKAAAQQQFPEQRILAIACPYEKPRFEDAAKVVAHADDLIVSDIADLLVQSMGI